MQRAKRLQFFLIIAAVGLTLINVLPTIFYYSQPLSQAVDAPYAEKVASQIAQRVNRLEKDAKDWVKSYASTLNLKPKSINFSSEQADTIQVKFDNSDDAELFSSHVARAGQLISFSPAQIYPTDSSDPCTVTLKRLIPLHFNTEDVQELFTYCEKRDANQSITDKYRSFVEDRLAQINTALNNSGEGTALVDLIIAHPQQVEIAAHFAGLVSSYKDTFGASSAPYKRFIQNSVRRQETLEQLVNALDMGLQKVKIERISLEKEDTSQLSRLKQLQNFEASLAGVKKNLQGHSIKQSAHPFIERIEIDWDRDKIQFYLHNDVNNPAAQTLVFDEMARIGRETNESIEPSEAGFAINLSQSPSSQSLLLFDLGKLAQTRTQSIHQTISSSWNPTHIDFQKDSFPIWDINTYKSLNPEEQSLGLLVYAPAADRQGALNGLKRQSIYVIAKGADHILKKYQDNPNSPQAQEFLQDFKALSRLLEAQGFRGYPGANDASLTGFSKDFIFELEDYYSPLLSATREDFSVLGSRQYAALELDTVEQRLLIDNRIDNQIHEDLLKWKDDYQSAQVSRDPRRRLEVAKPLRNTLISNWMLSAKKYFRGDERKVLHWGLDLSGGKTVRIELRDQNGKTVTNEADIDQGINELYTRVNKMGVSEVKIRREGSHIILDFPGSQHYSASDLVKASSMYFHVVNEQFSPYHPTLGEATQRFLQTVWNEATLKNKTDTESIHQIAYHHLNREGRSEAANTLVAHGLRLANPSTHSIESAYNDQLSKIAMWRGDEPQDWNDMPHPLMIVFNNYALEGAALADVRSGYDSVKGNYLSYSVKSADARDTLSAWTSHFCKDAVQNTPLAECTHGRGWRMAVILNGSIVNAATLESRLCDSAMISGSFSPREIQKLEADIKAGSLTFAPRILSEENISPELGAKDRFQGIIATLIALCAVVALMVGYYRFAGLVASVAVIFNLMMMWATLQNIQAALTLAGIAGIILTLGMAVDANVLVFERVREEFQTSGNIKSALIAGYRKAFTAIVDSNVTTLIAAVILLNFDSGPIKAFAIMLIIGIVSSMFSALLLTRAYFMRWVDRTKKPILSMACWIKARSFDFLHYARYAIIVSMVITLIGGWCLIKSRHSILGMDFTGGYALTVEVEADRDAVKNAILQQGIHSEDFAISELSNPQHLRLHFSANLENAGAPFYQMPFALDNEHTRYEYQKNPRLNWIVNALHEANIHLKSDQYDNLDQKWHAMSGQISDAMTQNAIIGVVLALICILLYITIRFEFKYAVSATLSLAHDVILTISSLSILHWWGFPVQIDLTTVAALMTIVGYSLNDTIIVFDRIREDVRLNQKKKNFRDLINQAVNVTLSRTLMTSLTTLVVLLSLVIFGGFSILGFALMMTLGVIIGTFSSLFIATTLMWLFHKREQKNQDYLQAQAV